MRVIRFSSSNQIPNQMFWKKDRDIFSVDMKTLNDRKRGVRIRKNDQIFYADPSIFLFLTSISGAQNRSQLKLSDVNRYLNQVAEVVENFIYNHREIA